jgi:hypothetical protein
MNEFHYGLKDDELFRVRKWLNQPETTQPTMTPEQQEPWELWLATRLEANNEALIKAAASELAYFDDVQRGFDKYKALIAELRSEVDQLKARLTTIEAITRGNVAVLPATKSGRDAA